VRDAAEVDDIASEWLDRFGPPPEAAVALLAIARLRAQCVRTGVREVTAVAVRPGGGGPGRPGEVVARISPLKLRASAGVRLKRLVPRAVVKDDVEQVILPLKAGRGVAAALAELLGELVPIEPAGAVAE
jgi:transcription-repair coupling factor (superfamily II helicase)